METRAFVWDRGVFTDLPTPPGSKSAAAALPHPFLWQQGTMIDLLGDHPAVNGTAHAINAAGLAYRIRADQYIATEPFRWESGRTKLFTTPYPSAEVGIVGIDSAGRITASIITDDEAILLRSVG